MDLKCYGNKSKGPGLQKFLYNLVTDRKETPLILLNIHTKFVNDLETHFHLFLQNHCQDYG